MSQHRITDTMHTSSVIDVYGGLGEIAKAYKECDFIRMNRVLSSVKHRTTLAAIEGYMVLFDLTWRDVLFHADDNNAPALWLEYFWTEGDRTDLLNVLQGPAVDKIRTLHAMRIVPALHEVSDSEWLENTTFHRLIVNTVQKLLSDTCKFQVEEKDLYL